MDWLAHKYILEYSCAVEKKLEDKKPTSVVENTPAAPLLDLDDAAIMQVDLQIKIISAIFLIMHF